MRKVWAMTLALALASGSAVALEAATTGSQATQATVGAINSKVDVTNNFINAMMKCNAARKFYAPADPKKDTDGCVGTGDYDLNMASGSNVNLANGKVYGTQVASNDYGLRVNSNYIGVRGDAPNSWGGYFTGTYGVYGQSTSTWAGEFYGYGSDTGGVYIGNTSNNARLCLNGKCTTNLPSAPVVNVRATSVYGWRWPAAAISCASNEVVTGGGGYCSSGQGFAFSIYSIPNGNGWYYACTDEKQEYVTTAVYAMCLVK